MIIIIVMKIQAMFEVFLKKCGIASQLTPPRALQHNRFSKRINHTFLDMVLSIMGQAELSMSFWGHALEIVALTLIHVPSKVVRKTPHEIQEK